MIPMSPQRKKIFTLRGSDFVDVCGERGIRTHGELPHTCFQDKRLKPLGHLSDREKYITKSAARKIR